MLTSKITCDLTGHFNKEEHQMSDFEFFVIEQICNVSDDSTNSVCSPGRLFGASNYARFNLMRQSIRNFSIPANCFLDEESDTTYINEDLAEELGVQG